MNIKETFESRGGESFRSMGQSLNRFSLFDEHEICSNVMAAIESTYNPYIIIHSDWNGENQYYLKVLDDELIALLDQSPSLDLARSLNLRNSIPVDLTRIKSDTPVMSIGEICSALGKNQSMQVDYVDRTAVIKPQIAVDETNRVLALSVNKIKPISFVEKSTPRVLSGEHSGASLVESTYLTMFPGITSLTGEETEPDATMEFVLKLNTTPQIGVNSAIDLCFPEGQETVNVLASITTTDFERPSGQSWRNIFTIDRQGTSDPSAWEFTAKATGDRKQYSLTVKLHSMGIVIGSLTFSAVRKGSGRPPGGPPPIHPVRLPSETGAYLLIDISEEANGHIKFELIENGDLWSEESISFNVPNAQIFEELQVAKTPDELFEVGWNLRTSLPQQLANFLDRPEVHGKPTLISSNSRIAPFEIYPLLINSKPHDFLFLGIDRPVLRWIPDKPMAQCSKKVIKQLACIRPSYTGNSALESAQKEEEFLSDQFSHSLTPIKSITHLETLLEQDKTMFLHFAGHTDHNPASLLFPENTRFKASKFNPTKKAVLNHPVFFLNGCKAGAANSEAWAATGNFVRSLLVAEFSAVIANSIAIDSKAAKRATEEFYLALLNDRTIPEAVQSVRTLAMNSDTPAEQKSTFLSYLAFSPAHLTIQFDPAIEKTPLEA